MQQSSQAERQSSTSTRAKVEQAGLYVYCVAPGGQDGSLGEIGIDGHAVYTVAHGDICAVVHACPAQPYSSEDGGVAAAWVLAHHRVVEATWKRWGTALPLNFNTIIRAGNSSSASENLRMWLETERESLKGRLDAFRGKAEYGVQVFGDPAVIARQTAEATPEIMKLEEEICSKPRGVAYMYRQKLERLLKREMEARASEEFKTLYGRLSRVADNIHVEKVKEAEEGRQMLMNLSCLLPAERFQDFKAELDRVGDKGGSYVRLVGPLPPYSFC
ncbi:MAG: GvpL/GvpF family gas vesicle protein [Chloroflexi bacterium]|nr:GvpL/GvpF family gas vesicle protein [Chloroflexota bacterium]